MNQDLMELLLEVVIALLFGGLILFLIIKLVFGKHRRTSIPIRNNITTKARGSPDNKAKSKIKINALVADEVEGLVYDQIEESQYTFKQIGRKRKLNFAKSECYLIRRDKDGIITPITPHEKIGEVTPEDAGAALEDPDSAEYFSLDPTLIDFLHDHMLQIVIFCEIGAIFIISLTMTGG